MGATTWTISPRAADVRRQIEHAPMLHAVDFFKIFVVTDEDPDVNTRRGPIHRGHWHGQTRSGTEKFLLDDEKWRKLQLYVKTSKSLPTTVSGFTVRYGNSSFDALTLSVVFHVLGVFKSIIGNCLAFEKDYTHVVSLANDVVAYAKYVESKYPTIQRLFNDVINSSNYSARNSAALQLRNIFADLHGRTEACAVRTFDTFKFIEKFKLDISSDQTKTKIMGEAVSKQDTEYNTDIKNIQNSIKEKHKELDKFNAAYEAALATSKKVPAYIWIPIFGWIAGTIKSAQASAQAKAALTEVRRLDAELEKMDRDFKHAAKCKVISGQFSSQVNNVSANVNGALDTLAIMTSAWLRIADDCKDISSRLVEWQDNLDIFAQWDFEATQKTWAEVRQLAQDYVDRAFIETSEDTRMVFGDSTDCL